MAIAIEIIQMMLKWNDSPVVMKALITGEDNTFDVDCEDCGVFVKSDGGYYVAEPSDCHSVGGHYVSHYDSDGNFVRSAAPPTISSNQLPLTKEEMATAQAKELYFAWMESLANVDDKVANGDGAEEFEFGDDFASDADDFDNDLSSAGGLIGAETLSQLAKDD